MIVSEPQNAYALNARIKVGLITPFVYESESDYSVVSINSKFSLASVTAIKVHRFDSVSQIFACGAFTETNLETNSAIWQIDANTG